MRETERVPGLPRAARPPAAGTRVLQSPSPSELAHGRFLSVTHNHVTPMYTDRGCLDGAGAGLSEGGGGPSVQSWGASCPG